ncbi:SOS response-associated peptidase [Planctomicrobium piriforme]|uniref:Abasic site processing protein n=1 Tax=Planctomicrobium piriforme TaxID=1576369 RepID=A0A1I3HDP8_9PLAN|nr:SOS response-associated peptidase [Planctomicrobium piriforme]SFI33866.1 Putative SOS response-associated peptidase YedK [Planctomicrobium piriforme]
MCGRFTLRVSPALLAEMFALHRKPEFVPQTNICPTQLVLGVVLNQENGLRDARLFRWGLIPHWAKDPVIGASLINARSETISTKPAFRAAFQRRRCLIPADGFYEWRNTPGQKKKQPIWIAIRNQPVFGFASLWETWTSADGSELNTCTIITTQANSAVAPIHQRMPVILPEAFHEHWLDPLADPAELLTLLRPFPSEGIVLSTTVADELLASHGLPRQRTLFD